MHITLGCKRKKWGPKGPQHEMWNTQNTLQTKMFLFIQKQEVVSKQQIHLTVLKFLNSPNVAQHETWLWLTLFAVYQNRLLVLSTPHEMVTDVE